MMILAGQTKQIEIRVRNYRPKTMQIEGALVLPEGWKATPQRISLSVDAKSSASTKASITIPTAWTDPLSRVAIALDVLADGKYLGQIAEAVVDIRARNA